MSSGGRAIWPAGLLCKTESTAAKFSGFLTVSATLDGFSDSQEQADEVILELSLRDYSGRNPYANVASTVPSAVCLDNVELDGTLS